MGTSLNDILRTLCFAGITKTSNICQRIKKSCKYSYEGLLEAKWILGVMQKNQEWSGLKTKLSENL